MFTPLMLWFGSSLATSAAKGPAQTSVGSVGSEAFLGYGVSPGCFAYTVNNVIGLHGVAVVVMQQTVNLGVVVQATSEGVEGAVLLDQDDNILDLVLQRARLLVLLDVARVGVSKRQPSKGGDDGDLARNHRKGKYD